MKRLWAPWRIEYILGPKPDECVFCIKDIKGEDEERLILFRGNFSFVIMNKYPYNTGHIMVTPYRHIHSLEELKEEEQREMMWLLVKCTEILKEVFHPQGINIGLNIGEVAGAGIKEHLHFHLVPRWSGDHSFMAVFAETMVIPEALKITYKKLKGPFEALNPINH